MKQIYVIDDFFEDFAATRNYAFAGDRKFPIHCDFMGYYSAFVYLSTRDQCAGKIGTNFYERIVTGERMAKKQTDET